MMNRGELAWACKSDMANPFPEPAGRTPNGSLRSDRQLDLKKMYRCQGIHILRKGTKSSAETDSTFFNYDPVFLSDPTFLVLS